MFTYSNKFLKITFQYPPVAACDVDTYSNSFLAVRELTPCKRFSFAHHSRFYPL